MYKSRTLAAEAIKGGKVKLGDQNLKPSHIVKIGERYSMSIGYSKKIIEVKELVEKRVKNSVTMACRAGRNSKPDGDNSFRIVHFEITDPLSEIKKRKKKKQEYQGIMHVKTVLTQS